MKPAAVSELEAETLLVELVARETAIPERLADAGGQSRRGAEVDIMIAEVAPSHTRARTPVAVNLGGRPCLIQLRFTYSISALAADRAEIEYLMRSGVMGPPRSDHRSGGAT